MFQNMNESTMDMEKNRIKENTEGIFSNVLSKKYIVIYIVAFMLSQVSISGDFSVFSISMLGACFASSVPLLGIVGVSLVGTLIRYGAGGVLGYFLTALVMIVSLFILFYDINIRMCYYAKRISNHFGI